MGWINCVKVLIFNVKNILVATLTFCFMLFLLRYIFAKVNNVYKNFCNFIYQHRMLVFVNELLSIILQAETIPVAPFCILFLSRTQNLNEVKNY